MFHRLLVLASVSLLALACNSTNPVEPAPNGGGNGSGGGSGSVVVTVKSDRGQVEAGSTVGANLTVTAQQNGAPVADGMEVALSTNLGNFGVDGAGKPVQLVKLPLSGGSASASFYAASTDLGTANILAQVGTSVGKLNLPLVAPSVAPVANFSFEISALSVLFSDTSTGTPTAWDWDFGDGATTSRQNPMHTYTVAGTYTVSLTVTNASGQTSNKRQFVTVMAGDPLLASFTFSLNGLKVLFMDASIGTPTSWIWHFGDGTGPVSMRNPVHTYAKAGTYTVTLSITNAFGVSDATSQFVTVAQSVPLQADFEFTTAGTSAGFFDRSAGSPKTWSWTFGDGGTSTVQNPTHDYGKSGTFNVTLTVTNDTDPPSSKTKLVTVSQGDPPVADFTFQATVRHVVFADQSTNSPTSWSWDFGDGAKSTQQNPSHDYAQAGTYAVILTATNAAGSGSKTKLVTVTDTKPPVAAFCYQRNMLQVVFIDQSAQSPTQWQWSFGECTTNPSCQSSAQNPSYTYGAAGTYQVTLTASNAGGQSTVSKFVTVGTTVDASPICN